MIIASYHIDYIFHTGWIFVEFFFIILGLTLVTLVMRYSPFYT